MSVEDPVRESPAARALQAAAALRGEWRRAGLEDPRPRALLVLGSGLAELADRVENGTSTPFDALPGFVAAGVSGHAGRYVVGTLAGVPVLVQSGRIHAYEGHAMDRVVHPVRTAVALGIPAAVFTNAAGGIGRHLAPGDVMLIDDHIDLMFRSPLAGAVEEREDRFPDMSAPYDPDLQQRALAAALDAGVPMRRGTYAAVLGPSYETPAEIRMLARMGADAVGMSTVPEVITARAAGMTVLAFSMITNPAAGTSGLAPLNHSEVMDVGRRAGTRLARVIEGVVRGLPSVTATRTP